MEAPFGAKVPKKGRKVNDMKRLKKALALALALTVVFAFTAVGAFAQTSGTAAEGKGSITIDNAAKGEKYSVVKLFDATLSDDNSGISYTGDIPSSLSNIFEKDSIGNIHVKKNVTEEQVAAAVTKWAKTQSPSEVTSDGTALTFEGLDYGYYAVISSQGTAVTINSTKPDATVYDKNTKDITAEKTVEEESYTIGDTIKYTATFDTVNFYGEGDASKQVLNYTITDSLPDFMSDATITKITITEKDGKTTAKEFTNKNFNSDGEVVIDWAKGIEGTSNPKKWESLYENGAKIIVKYEATLTSDTNINAADTNTVKIQPQVVKDDGTPDDKKPWEDSWEDSAEIKTYAAALKKTDGTKALKGAKFAVNGLTVEKTDSGVYTVVSYDSSSTTQGTEMTTDDNGMLYIVGLAENVSLSVTETKAPSGYTKATAPITLTPQKVTEKIIKKSGTVKYDADGNVISSTSEEDVTTTVDETKNLNKLDAGAVEVVNVKGNPLPSTGGIGTTIFYIVGAILVVGAGILLISKRRMAAK